MTILVSAISGFIAGLLASIFATGVRKMLAKIIISRKLYVGKIIKTKELSGTSWYIPVCVKANNMWNLVVSSINDVKAIITFVEHKDNQELYLPKQGAWINEIDGSLDNLGIGTQRDIRFAEEGWDGILMPVNWIAGEILRGNQDILLELKTGNTSLGCWLFQKAIVEGSTQEVSPIKVNFQQLISHKEGS